MIGIRVVDVGYALRTAAVNRHDSECRDNSKQNDSMGFFHHSRAGKMIRRQGWAVDPWESFVRSCRSLRWRGRF